MVSLHLSKNKALGPQNHSLKVKWLMLNLPKVQYIVSIGQLVKGKIWGDFFV